MPWLQLTRKSTACEKSVMRHEYAFKHMCTAGYSWVMRFHVLLESYRTMFDIDMLDMFNVWYMYIYVSTFPSVCIHMNCPFHSHPHLSLSAY